MGSLKVLNELESAEEMVAGHPGVWYSIIYSSTSRRWTPKPPWQINFEGWLSKVDPYMFSWWPHGCGHAMVTW